MSSLLARVMLAIFMLPLAALVYLVSIVSYHEVVTRNYYNRDSGWWFSGAVTWLFIAIYWILLWMRSVQWTPSRRLLTALSVLLCGVTGVVAATGLNQIERGFGTFVGTALAPLLWLASTTFIFRESTAERTERVAGAKNALVCPNCGYNLTGLTTPRCPECGKQFTLDELVASQPERGNGEL